MYSAKTLPSATHDIRHTATKDSAKPPLPSAISRALGKALPSAELALGKKKLGGWPNNDNRGFAMCLNQGTRQRFKSLPDAFAMTLGKELKEVNK